MRLISFVPKREMNYEETGEPGTVYPYGQEPIYILTRPAIVPTTGEEAIEFAQSTRYAPASKELYQALTMAQEWIDNLIEAIGVDQTIDAMPNNCGGRLQIGRALENAERLDLLEKKSKRGSPWSPQVLGNS